MNEVKTSEEGKSSAASTNAVNCADKEKAKSFREQAIKTHLEAKRQQEVHYSVEKDKFVAEARKRFKEVFDKEAIISKTISDAQAEITYDDVTFIAERRDYDIVFMVVVTCQHCGDEFLPRYANPVTSLADIGGRLSAPQTCDKCRDELRGGDARKSTAELVLEKVREIYDLVREEEQ